MRVEPCLERRVAIRIGRFEAGERPANSQLLTRGKVMRPEKAPRQVQRRRQPIRLEAADPPVGRHEMETRLRLQELGYPHRMHEVTQVGAASHADVLARVYELTRGGVCE